MADITVTMDIGHGDILTLTFPEPSNQAISRISAELVQSPRGKPEYARDYRPGATIKFVTSLDQLRELVRTLNRVM